MEKKGCKHYQRECDIKAPCCGEFFPCRLCHNDAYQPGSGCQVEELDRYAIAEVKCRGCEEIQPQSNACVKCEKQFATYFCNICHLWDSNPKKSIYHCEKCNICRVGKKENFEHCDTCGYCIAKGTEHTCATLDKNDTCSVCWEPIFSSRNGIHRLKCKHYMHPKCFSSLLKRGIINCPLCFKPMIEESDEYIEEVDRLNEENKEKSEEIFKGKTETILCNRCLKKSYEVKIQLFGIKCPECKSYNTKPI